MSTHSDAQERRPREPKEAAGEGMHPSENLALLYQGLLTGIVRLKARRQHITDAESFRRRTKATLEEVERVAVAAGYEGRDIRETHFAVVAFLDSVVLNSNEPVRAEWERRPLQEELFGQTDAGVVFFEKLDHFRTRRDSDQLADILEVYLLCLLLGFEGRYAGGLRGELHSITEKVRTRIEDIRGWNRQISPSGDLPRDVTAPAPVPMVHRPERCRMVAIAAAIFTILCFLALKWNLLLRSGEVADRFIGPQ
jgi:type VI secretion system protein ImpK